MQVNVHHAHAAMDTMQKKKKLTNKAHPALRVLSCMEILTATIKCAYA